LSPSYRTHFEVAVAAAAAVVVPAAAVVAAADIADVVGVAVGAADNDVAVVVNEQGLWPLLWL